ncbi:hypothetical protein SAMN05192544_10048 [Paraburkholderia hospita]|jgi:hypothetical protein|nr:hypothetical protein SAMN05192544_10048 [Paraburkholderia hospita]
MEWPRPGTGMVGWRQRSFEVSDCRRGRGRLGLESRFAKEGNRKEIRDEKGDGKSGRREESQGSNEAGTGEEGCSQENCGERSGGEEGTCEADAAEPGSSCTNQR